LRSSHLLLQLVVEEEGRSLFAHTMAEPSSPRETKATFENLLRFGQKRRFYTPAEVAMHNSKDDCWVSIHGKVFDLAPLLAANKPELGRALILHAGKDISGCVAQITRTRALSAVALPLTHPSASSFPPLPLSLPSSPLLCRWFEADTLEIKTQLDPITGLVSAYAPFGRFPHVPPREPVSDWANDFVTPWWADTTYLIGALSKQTRFITIVNTIATQLSRTLLEVCSEETLTEIQERYFVHNAHAGSYAWKVADTSGDFRTLDMAQTLEENGIVDESAKLESLSLDPSEYYPVVTVYFKDDLTAE